MDGSQAVKRWEFLQWSVAEERDGVCGHREGNVGFGKDEELFGEARVCERWILSPQGRIKRGLRLRLG